MRAVSWRKLVDWMSKGRSHLAPIQQRFQGRQRTGAGRSRRRLLGAPQSKTQGLADARHDRVPLGLLRSWVGDVKATQHIHIRKVAAFVVDGRATGSEHGIKIRPIFLYVT